MDRQWCWTHATEFARWQHPAVGRGTRLFVLAPLVYLLMLNYKARRWSRRNSTVAQLCRANVKRSPRNESWLLSTAKIDNNWECVGELNWQRSNTTSDDLHNASISDRSIITIDDYQRPMDRRRLILLRPKCCIDVRAKNVKSQDSEIRASLLHSRRIELGCVENHRCSEWCSVGAA